jgi:hypothetical protein
MPEQPISSVFNDAYAAEQFETYRRDPASVEESWRQFFRFAEQAMGGYAPAAASSAAAGPVHDEEYARKVAGAARYTTAIRTYGHFAVQLDPLGTPPPGAPELTLEFFGIVEADLDIVTGASLGFPHLATARDVADRLKKRYCTNLAVEVQHLGSEEERAWFRQLFTEEKLTAPLTADEKQACWPPDRGGRLRALPREGAVGYMSASPSRAPTPWSRCSTRRSTSSSGAGARGGDRDGAPRAHQRARAHPRQAVRSRSSTSSTASTPSTGAAKRVT